MSVADALAMLVKGEWDARGLIELGESWVLRRKPWANEWEVNLCARSGDGTLVEHDFARGPTDVACVRKLLTHALTLAILLALKALPWREEPDPELGEWWWRLVGGVPLLEVVTRKPTRRFPGGELHIDGAPISGLLGGPWKWMLAVPPPEAP